jgi:hypothetical protein
MPIAPDPNMAAPLRRRRRRALLEIVTTPR